MTSKFLTKTIGKLKIWAIITAVVVVAGLVLGIVFGFNGNAYSKDSNALTVRVESFLNEEGVDAVEKVCEDAFKDQGIKYDYTVESESASGNIKEYVYSFGGKVSVEKLEQAQQNINNKFEAKKADTNDVLYNAFIYTAVNTENTLTTTAKGFGWRTVLAVVVAIVAIFVYTALRVNFHSSLCVTASTCVSLLLTLALTSIVRLPVGTSAVYAFALSAIYSAVLSVLFVSTLKKAFKSSENEGKDVQTVILENGNCKEVLFSAVALIVSLVLVGALAGTGILFTCLIGVVGVVSSAFVAGVLLPSAYLQAKTTVDKIVAIRSRYDYKKGGNKTEKTEEPTAETESEQK